MREKIKEMFLHSNNQFISGEEMSNKLNISRTAIWKQVEELKKEGYVIEAVRRKGYRLVNNPDDVFEGRIKEQIKTGWLGKSITYRKETTSTQHDAHELAKNGAPHGTIVIADTQTMGKGRLGRTWYSEKSKGLWVSLIIRPDFTYQRAPFITLLTSIVILDSLRNLYDIPAKIKWPNDIYINERKCSGILTEIHGEQDKIHYMVIGIGINTHKTDYPKEINHKAIALEEIIGKEPLRIDLLSELLMQFEKKYEVFISEGFQPFFHQYNSYLLWKGELKTIVNQGKEITGIIQGINDSGHLLIKKENGEVEAIYSGDIGLG